MTQERTFEIGDLLQHFKREDNPTGFNHCYVVVATNVQHTETGELLLVYKALYGECKTFARPTEMAMSEVDKEKYPNYSQKYRLEKITDEALRNQILEMLEGK